MKVLGIVAEYNPFHNGHYYHIQKAKDLIKADYTVVVMSGNFLQRGEPAFIDKYQRTRMALASQADLVLELPVVYSTASAEFFSAAAVLLLEKTGIVDYLCFGSECGDISLLNTIAKTLVDEPSAYIVSLNKELGKGSSYPLARSIALSQYLFETHQYDKDMLRDVLDNPNNILGIEYLKAIIKYNCSIKPLTINRVQAGYHEATLYQGISSATAIRDHILKNQSPESVLRDVPTLTGDILKAEYQKSYPIIADDFSIMLQYKLMTATNLTIFEDIYEDLADRITKINSLTDSFSVLASHVKSKQVTLTKISRSLLHILLDIKKQDLAAYREDQWIYYARVLGFKREASILLALMRKQAAIPVINKTADAKKQLCDVGMSMLQYDFTAAHLYNLIVMQTYKTVLPNEYIHGVIIH